MQITVTSAPTLRVRSKTGKLQHVFGLTTFKSKRTVEIQIADDLNDSVGQFAITLLHEFLHVWLSVLKANGAYIDSRKEHSYIRMVEDTVIRLSAMVQGGKNEKKK